MNSCHFLNVKRECFDVIVIGASFYFLEHFIPVGATNAKNATAKDGEPFFACELEPVHAVLLKVWDGVLERPLGSCIYVIHDDVAFLFATVVVIANRC